MGRRLAFTLALLLGVAVRAPALEVRVVDDDASVRAELLDILRAPLRAQWEGTRHVARLERRAFEISSSAGWPWSECAFDSTTETLYLKPGAAATIGAIRSAGTDSPAYRRFLEGSRLRSGQSWREERWRDALRAGLRHLGEAGHPFAAASLQSVGPDSLGGPGSVELLVWVAAGEVHRFGEFRIIEGARSSERGLRRLARLPTGEVFRQSSLEDMKARLQQREIVDAVERVEIRRAPGKSDRVDVYVALRQPERRGRFSAAVGVIEDRERNDTRVSGAVELELMDLFGSARQFGLAWLDDGRIRRRLDLRYLEPVVFGSPLDLAVGLGQRHEDELYDSILLDGSVRVPLQRAQTIEFGAGIDRTTFVSESVAEARVRIRRRLLVAFQLGRQRRPSRSFFGQIRSEFQAAWIRESGGGSETPIPPSQSLLRLGVAGGWQLRSRLALLARSNWQSVESDEELIPRSEQLALGGATTVRGYAEDQFRGERLGFGGVELEIGEPDGGRAYLFGDLGWIQSRRELLGVVESSEEWLQGFGLGLRSPLAVGAIDLSLAFAGEIRFETGKLHLKLSQEF